MIDISFLNHGISALMITCLGFFVKRWINGTAKEIKALEEGKRSVVECVLKEENNQNQFKNINDNLHEMKKTIQDSFIRFEDKIDALQPWDGQERRQRGR